MTPALRHATTQSLAGPVCFDFLVATLYRTDFDTHAGSCLWFPLVAVRQKTPPFVASPKLFCFLLTNHLTAGSQSTSHLNGGEKAPPPFLRRLRFFYLS